MEYHRWTSDKSVLPSASSFRWHGGLSPQADSLMPTWFVGCEVTPSKLLTNTIASDIHNHPRSFLSLPCSPVQAASHEISRDPNHLSLYGTQIIVTTCPSIIQGLNHSTAVKHSAFLYTLTACRPRIDYQKGITFTDLQKNILKNFDYWLLVWSFTFSVGLQKNNYLILLWNKWTTSHTTVHSVSRVN